MYGSSDWLQLPTNFGISCLVGQACFKAGTSMRYYVIC
jgi:hypothetical protein